MKKEFIVSRIEASQDSSPYVYITFTDPSDYKAGERSQTPFGTNAVAFSSPEDLMKNMPKIISGMVGGGGATGTPTLKMSMREYQDMSIKVGDKVTVEIKKSETSGI